MIGELCSQVESDEIEFCQHALHRGFKPDYSSTVLYDGLYSVTVWQISHLPI